MRFRCWKLLDPEETTFSQQDTMVQYYYSFAWYMFCDCDMCAPNLVRRIAFTIALKSGEEIPIALSYILNSSIRSFGNQSMNHEIPSLISELLDEFHGKALLKTGIKVHQSCYSNKIYILHMETVIPCSYIQKTHSYIRLCLFCYSHENNVTLPLLFTVW